jgi:hypothetical protein
MRGGQRGGEVHYPEVTYHPKAHILIRAEDVLSMAQVRHPVSHYLLWTRLTSCYILPLTGPGIALSTHTRARVGTIQVMVQSTTTRQSLHVQAGGPVEARVGL